MTLQLTDQDKVWVTEIDKVVYRNGELKRCYFKVDEYYLLRTFKDMKTEQVRALLTPNPESGILRHMDMEDIYSDKESCQAVVDRWNVQEAEKWHEE